MLGGTVFFFGQRKCTTLSVFMASGNKSQIFRLHSVYLNQQQNYLGEYRAHVVIPRDDGREREEGGCGGHSSCGASEDGPFPCSFPPVSLTPQRSVLEHQIVALYPDVDDKMRVFPDAAGLTLQSALDKEEWEFKAKWAVNQTMQPITPSMTFNLSCRPGIEETLLNTGADPIKDGDDVYVRIPTSRDLYAQSHCTLPFGGLDVVGDSFEGPVPLLATYGMSPASIDPCVRLHSDLESFRKKYAGGVIGEGSGGTDVASNLNMESIEKTTIITLAAMAASYHTEEATNPGYRVAVEQLVPHFEDQLPTVPERVLPTVRNSNLFLTRRGVAFLVKVMNMAHQLFENAKLRQPVGRVTQAHEQGKEEQTVAKTGELFRVVLF